MANPPGRPPLDRTDQSVGVKVMLPGRTFDVICKHAHAERLSVPEVIRRALRQTANKGSQTSDK